MAIDDENKAVDWIRFSSYKSNAQLDKCPNWVEVFLVNALIKTIMFTPAIH